MPSRRIDSVTPFLVMDVLARAQELERSGHDIVHFEVGEPDFPTPSAVKAAAVRALGADETHYTSARGRSELVECIVRHYERQYGVRIDQKQVIVSSGTSPVLMMAFLAMLDPGDEVIISRPAYPCYPNFVRLMGGEPVFVDALPEAGFQVDAAAIGAAMTEKTRSIIVNSPSNPTGAVLSGETLKGIANLGPTIVSDEIYHGLTYEGEEHSILEYTENAFVINGFSKLFSMTGWRLGYIIVPRAYLRTMEILQQNIFISANTFAQFGGQAALCDEDVRQETVRMRVAYDERRRIMIDGVRDLGLSVPVDPTGAFYVFADARKVTTDTLAFARRILEEAHVAVTPGEDFGSPGFLRFSYATNPERIREGLRRLKKVMA
jgi:(5-formylfuran-3-yl)methyl phosphate transaminase